MGHYGPGRMEWDTTAQGELNGTLWPRLIDIEDGMGHCGPGRMREFTGCGRVFDGGWFEEKVTESDKIKIFKERE